MQPRNMGIVHTAIREGHAIRISLKAGYSLEIVYFLLALNKKGAIYIGEAEVSILKTAVEKRAPKENLACDIIFRPTPDVHSKMLLMDSLCRCHENIERIVVV